MSGRAAEPVTPVDGELGLASWEPADLTALVMPAWDEFLEIAADVALDGRTRVGGWLARDVLVHLGAWPGSRSFQRMRGEAERDELGGAQDWADHRGATFDQDAHNEAVLAAHQDANRDELLAALELSRQDVSDYLANPAAADLARRPVRSVLGPLPLGTMAAAGAYELAVHALDLAPAGAARPSRALLSAGLAALADTTGALAARESLTARAACLTPDGGWAFAAQPGAWTTLELPEVPDSWPAVQGAAADVLDAAAGRRPIPPMLARRDLRVHNVAGLVALAPVVEHVPGLPGGAALRLTVRNVRRMARLARRLPGVG